MARVQAEIASSPKLLAQVSQSSAKAEVAAVAARNADAIAMRRQAWFGITPPWPPRINLYRPPRGCQHDSAGIVKTRTAAIAMPVIVPSPLVGEGAITQDAVVPVRSLV